jgi:hypothetical protein
MAPCYMSRRAVTFGETLLGVLNTEGGSNSIKGDSGNRLNLPGHRMNVHRCVTSPKHRRCPFLSSLVPCAYFIDQCAKTYVWWFGGLTPPLALDEDSCIFHYDMSDTTMTIKTNANCWLRTVISHRGEPGSVPDQRIWDMWWKKWHWDRFLSQHFSVPLSLSFHECSTPIHSLITDVI